MSVNIKTHEKKAVNTPTNETYPKLSTEFVLERTKCEMNIIIEGKKNKKKNELHIFGT